MHELIELLGPAVDGRVFSPKLPEDTRRKGMRERYTCDFPALAVRRMMGPGGPSNMLQVCCYGGNPAEAKSLAREAVELIEADGSYALVGRYDLTDRLGDDTGGPVCHIGLRLEPRQGGATTLVSSAAGEIT